MNRSHLVLVLFFTVAFAIAAAALRTISGPVSRLGSVAPGGRDGSVLLAGGYPDNPGATAQTWIYRP